VGGLAGVDARPYTILYSRIESILKFLCYLGHAHLILTPLVDTEHNRKYPLYEILGRIKAFSARTINDRLRFRSTFRQEESFDRVLRSSESRAAKIAYAKIAYMLANPVRVGLAVVPESYRWSWRRPRELCSPWGQGKIV